MDDDLASPLTDMTGTSKIQLVEMLHDRHDVSYEALAIFRLGDKRPNYLKSFTKSRSADVFIFPNKLFSM